MLLIALLYFILLMQIALVKISKPSSGLKIIQDFRQIFVNFDQKYKEEAFIIKLIYDNQM